MRDLALFALGYISAIVTAMLVFVWACLRLGGEADDRTEMDNDTPPPPAQPREARRDEGRGAG
jgi:hypothetical protein